MCGAGKDSSPRGGSAEARSSCSPTPRRSRTGSSALPTTPRSGLALAGPPSRPVEFLESYHGYGTGSGLSALPLAWKLLLGGLGLAALVYMVARGRRFGPPEEEGRSLAPPRREYVDSLAAVVARSKRRDAAVRPVQREARDAILRRASLPPDVDDHAVRVAAKRLGLADEDADALLRAAPDRRRRARPRSRRRPNQAGSPLMEGLRDRVVAEVAKVAVGQEGTVERILCALLVGGHVLLEGVPGVAKTLVANSVARALGLEFRRAQFTPDMLPSDLLGTLTLHGGELAFRPGPVFTSVLLADEINRTPPKTQAALLEAMEERQVTIEGTPRELPEPFLVLATQNPIEYEGTYPLPEAQLDRFLFKLALGYPDEEEERQILGLRHRGVRPATLDDVQPVVEPAELAEAGRELDATGVSDEVAGYVTAIVRATRTLPSVELGASPRAGVHLLAAAKAVARLDDRGYVTPDDVADVAPDVLRHRLLLRPEAELERYTADDAVRAALEAVPVPR